MKTRSRVTTADAELEPTMSKGVVNQTQDPLHLMILPEGTSPQARICTLSHPRTSTPCRYYFCPEKGLYEFTRIAAPKSARHSWLLGRQSRKVDSAISELTPSEQIQDGTPQSPTTSSSEDGASRPVSNGYVIKNPELIIATPFDPVFLIIPALYANSALKAHSRKGLFLSVDDILEAPEEGSKHFKAISSNNRFRVAIESRIRSICDTVEAGDESMFRLSSEKLLAGLVAKARKMVEMGLPASMEDKFVCRALERPVMALKREQSSLSETTKLPSEDSTTTESAAPGRLDSQESSNTSLTMESEISSTTELTIPCLDTAVKGSSVCHGLLRLRVALSYMLSSYVPHDIATQLNAILASADSPIDFKPLDEELATIAKMRSEALASRSLSDFSRKRSADNDEAADRRAEKKAKKEEDERKKKAGDTRGLRDLKKVDTSGMKKMSDFFGKKPVVKKK